MLKVCIVVMHVADFVLYSIKVIDSPPGNCTHQKLIRIAIDTICNQKFCLSVVKK